MDTNRFKQKIKIFYFIEIALVSIYSGLLTLFFISNLSYKRIVVLSKKLRSVVELGGHPPNRCEPGTKVLTTPLMHSRSKEPSYPLHLRIQEQ